MHDGNVETPVVAAGEPHHISEMDQGGVQERNLTALLASSTEAVQNIKLVGNLVQWFGPIGDKFP